MQTVVARERHSPRRIVCKRDGWVTPSRRTRIRASERSRARVSFDVLQKSKSWVWHRGSAGTVKSGAGVHGCLGRCRSLRPTGVAPVAIEGTQGTVIVAAKPRRDSSSLVENRKDPTGAASDLGPGSRESSPRWKAPWVVDARKPSRVPRRSGLGFVERQSPPMVKRQTHCESTGASEARLAIAARGRQRLVPALIHPPQPALAS